MANTSSKTTTARSKSSQSKAPPQANAIAARKPRAISAANTLEINPELRQQMIAEAAYLRAEQRNFNPGDPLDDWLVAEREVDMLLIERTLQVRQ